MTAHMIPLYGASILTIGMLAMFARHNRKTGWTKQRSLFASWLSSFYEERSPRETVSEDALPIQPIHTAPAWTPMAAAESVRFSAQLINLRTALGNAGATPAVHAEPQTRELVRK